MSLPSQTTICIRTKGAEWKFDWRAFDGDDCFEAFEIAVTESGQTRHYDFGPCAKMAVRKLRSFFRDGARDTVGGGFRNPDIRTYDINRVPHGYRLTIRFEGTGLHDEFQLGEPEVVFEPEYVRHYDGIKT